MNEVVRPYSEQTIEKNSSDIVVLDSLNVSAVSNTDSRLVT